MSSSVVTIPFDEFLAERPPGSAALVLGALREPGTGDDPLLLPPIRLWCPDASCGGVRVFDPITRVRTGDGRGQGSSVTTRSAAQLLRYQCRNCREAQKLFAVLAARVPAERLPADIRESHVAAVTKVGEYPYYGPPVPTRVNRFLGPERDLFFKGMRAESQGMGIAAFAYYRRVVESQKERLLNQISKTAELAGAGPEVLDRLASAAAEDQFSKSVKAAGDAVPAALGISGHNPLLLLHRALSQGLHDATDSQCLQAAHDVRVVLFELAERIEQLLEEKRELGEAVKRLAD